MRRIRLHPWMPSHQDLKRTQHRGSVEKFNFFLERFENCHRAWHSCDEFRSESAIREAASEVKGGSAACAGLSSPDLSLFSGVKRRLWKQYSRFPIESGAAMKYFRYVTFTAKLLR